MPPEPDSASHDTASKPGTASNTATDTDTDNSDSHSDTSASSAAVAETSATSGPACPDCDDDNVCTYDQCQPKTSACKHIPLPATTTCATDEDSCTAEWCNGSGGCVVYATRECP